MSHSLTSGMQTVTEDAICAPVYFVEIDTKAGNVYLWTGIGNFYWNGQTWLGGGNLLSISPISESVNIQAAGVSFTLSGISSAYIALILESVQRYLPAKLWVGAVDDDIQIIPDPYLLFYGRIDTASIAASGKTISVTVTAESRLIAMKNPKWRRYTDQDQKIEHPGDNGFSQVDTLQDCLINFNPG